MINKPAQSRSIQVTGPLPPTKKNPVTREEALAEDSEVQSISIGPNGYKRQTKNIRERGGAAEKECFTDLTKQLRLGRLLMHRGVYCTDEEVKEIAELLGEEVFRMLCKEVPQYFFSLPTENHRI
jgi:hypothetical protein